MQPPPPYTHTHTHTHTVPLLHTLMARGAKTRAPLFRLHVALRCVVLMRIDERLSACRVDRGSGLCFSLCVCVCVSSWQSAVYFFAPLTFRSADNRGSGNGSFCSAALGSEVLIATHNCHFELRQGFISRLVALLIYSFGDDLFRFVSTADARMRQ